MILLFNVASLTFSQPVLAAHKYIPIREQTLEDKVSPNLLKAIQQKPHQVTVSISLKIVSQWPQNSNHVSLSPSELTTDQIKHIFKQQDFIIKRKLQATANFITKNDGIVFKITPSQSTGFIAANVSSSFIPKLAAQKDVNYIGEMPYDKLIERIKHDVKDDNIVPKDTLVKTKVAGEIYAFSCSKIGGKIVKENSTNQDFCNYNGDYYRVIDAKDLICTQAFITIMDMKTGKQFTFNTGCGMPYAKDGSWKKL
jgi:hypothetical protein